MKYPRTALCLFAALIAGCSEDGPPTGTVSGRVTIAGEAPSEPVRVNFINSIIGQGAAATTGDDGRYTLDQPLRVGEYTVYFERIVSATGPVSTAEEQLTIVPPEYRSEQSSPLKEEVVEGGNTIDLELPAP